MKIKELLEDTQLNELAAFHGSFRPRIGKFKPFTHFGTEKAAKDRLEYLTAEDPRFKGVTTGYLYKLDLGMNNPATVKDYPELGDPNNGDMAKIRAWYNDLQKDTRVKGYKYSDGERPLSWYAKSAQTGYWQDYMKADEFLAGFVHTLRNIGIDGLVYKNKVENAGELSYIAFSPDNVRVVGRAIPVKLEPPEGVERKEKWTKPTAPATLPPPKTKPWQGQKIYYILDAKGNVHDEVSANDEKSVKDEIRDMRDLGINPPRGYTIVLAPGQ